MSKAWAWLKEKWNKFDAWVASWAPGVKTKIVAALGALGNAAYTVQQFVIGIPANDIVNARNLVILNLILFTLAFWFRGMGERHDV